MTRDSNPTVVFGFPMGTHTLAKYIDQGCDGDPVYLFNIGGSFVPYLVAVRTPDGASDAYEWIICECDHQFHVSTDDMKADNPTIEEIFDGTYCVWNDNGEPVDTDWLDYLGEVVWGPYQTLHR